MMRNFQKETKKDHSEKSNKFILLKYVRARRGVAMGSSAISKWFKHMNMQLMSAALVLRFSYYLALEQDIEAGQAGKDINIAWLRPEVRNLELKFRAGRRVWGATNLWVSVLEFLFRRSFAFELKNNAVIVGVIYKYFM